MTAPPAPDVVADAAPPAERPGRPWWRRHLFELVVALAFVGCVLTGTTTTSIAATPLRLTPGTPVAGLVAGEPRAVRSDEWLTNSPIVAGVLATKTADPVTPLAQSYGFVLQVPRGGVAESLVFFDGSLLFAPLPDAMLFAANWWLPVLFLGLFLPSWLQRLGVGRPLAVLATWLTLLAPVSQWWSYALLRGMAYTVAGALAVMVAVDLLERDRRGWRRWVAPTLLVLAAGILLARIPTWYAPWAITVSVTIVLATLGFLLARPAPRRVTWLVLGATTVATVVLLGGTVAENLDALRAYGQTVYPGVRRTSGAALPAYQVWGAPALAELQDDPVIGGGSNASELATGFTVAAVWAAVLALFALVTRRRSAAALDSDPPVVATQRGVTPAPQRASTVALVVVAVLTACWLAWCTLPWGALGESVPIANRVLPQRAAQSVGILAVLLAVLVLARFQQRVARWLPALVAAVVCAGITGYAARGLRAVTPTGRWTIVAAAAGVFVVVLLVTRFPRRWWPTVVAVALAGVVVATVNPIQRGLGSFRDNPTADQLLAAGDQARAGGYLWASNSFFVDALFTATGVPSLSGRQITGPVRSQWAKLDPTGRFEQNWNRGSAYVEFAWVPGAPLSMANPGEDQIVITVDPCALPATGLPVRRIVSSTPLTESCLTPVSTFAFSGATQTVYAIG